MPMLVCVYDSARACVALTAQREQGAAAAAPGKEDKQRPPNTKPQHDFPDPEWVFMDQRRGDVVCACVCALARC